MSDDPLSPYDAVLVCSYGGPDGPDAVLAFLRNAVHGKPVPEERLMEVAKHYDRFDGVSPINARNAELVAALRGGLAQSGSSVPVYLANRNWRPFFVDVMREMVMAGHRRVLMIPTAAYASYSGCREYRENLADARDALVAGGLDEAAELQIERAPLYYLAPGFVAANARAVVTAVDSLGGRPHIMFVTHSIPNAMQDASGLPGHDYVTQHREHIAALLAQLPERIHSASLPASYELCYCSRSGSPRVPWLVPDVNDAIEQAAAKGHNAVVVAPIGFIQDHMEVANDLDHEARETAEQAGVRFARAETAGDDAEFIASLAHLLLRRAQAARDGLSPHLTGCDWHDADPKGCCASRPGAISERNTI